ncbi:hypothetical protein A2U01_0061188, partial [Trifolium medium]|nr:hypothetical protein [Trifolium medium]
MRTAFATMRAVAKQGACGVLVGLVLFGLHNTTNVEGK